MKWILFLIFLEQGHEPLVEYKNASECVNALNQLQAASQKINPPNEKLINAGIISSYICQPVPIRYEGARCKTTRCR